MSVSQTFGYLHFSIFMSICMILTHFWEPIC